MSTHDPSTHRRAWHAIPWLVAGSACTEDRALLELHLPGCEECRAELQFQQRVQAGLGDTAQAETDPEPGLRRLLARIEAAEGGQGAEAVLSTVTPRRAAPGWTRWLAAAVVVQAVGLGAAGLALLDRQQRDGDYRTLSQPAATAASPAVLRLVPAPGMDFGTLRQLLAETRLAVVETAPDAGSIGLAPLDGDPRTAIAALPRLRGQAGVLLAEPTGRGP